MTLEIQVLVWDKHENVAGFCSRIILFKIEIYRIISVLKVEIYFITSTVVSLISRSIMHVKTFETDVFVFICKMKMCLTSHRAIIFIIRVCTLILTISLSEKCINYWESKIVFIYKSYIRKMYSQRFDETSRHKNKNLVSEKNILQITATQKTNWLGICSSSIFNVHQKQIFMEYHTCKVNY